MPIDVKSCPVCGCPHSSTEIQLATDWQFIQCPNKKAIYKVKSENNNTVASCLLNEDEAYLGVGNDILKNSRTTLREFSTFMTTLSSGAIATYFALIAFVIPKDISFSPKQSAVLAIPAVLFLICIAIFLSAYFPSAGTMNLNSVSSIMEKHKAQLGSRYISIIWGIAFFSAAIASMITITISFRFLVT